MKPAPFEYLDPDSVEGALDALAAAGDGAAIIAGGQSLVPLLNLRLARPEVIIDIRRIRPLGAWGGGDDGFRLGAGVTAAALLEDGAAAAVPGLHAALRHVAHGQIRNRTTVGGSIAHADPAAELPAWLVASGGSVVLASRARGERVVDAAEFFTGPFSTTREPDELLTAVRVPRLAGAMVVQEVARRPGDFAMAGVVAGRSGPERRLVAFGAGPSPLRLHDAEATWRELDGGAARADRELVEHVCALAREGVSPTDDIHGSADYRRHLIGVLVARAMAALEEEP